MRLIIQAATLISVIQAWVMFMHQRAVRRAGRPLNHYGPLFPREQERIQNLNYIYNCNDVEALWMLRMKRAPFARLVETFRSRGLLQDSINTSVEEQVAMFLHVVGHNQRFRVVHNMFRRSMETISRYFKQVLFAVGELRGEMIRRPSGQTPPKIRGSPRWYPYFKDCIEAIDGTHVTARVPRSQSAAYRGRKHYTSQNVLAAVDFDLGFTYVLAGWEGSAHEANILTDSMSRPDGINIPDGKFYLGDAGYACRPGVLPSFRKTRYHLNEFSGRNFPRTPQELLNLRHSSLRVTVERAFGALKNRFKILDQKPFHPYPTQVKLVLACCILHNWILQWGFDEHVPEEEEVKPDDVVSSGHGVEAFDNDGWKNKMLEWGEAMWLNRGQCRI
nr:putative nuclease HARBI1 [Aegilops tauschii subsp. strangulata]